ncbi:MAG: TerC family protein [Deltaproteobacteria bacterium]|nr:TerC family protein [Deltaproteobacteria bacterium]
MFTGFDRADTWIALVSLVAMEIVLGVDNIVFISVLTGRLPEVQRRKVTRLGIGLALVMRIGLLFAISWVLGLTRPLFTVAGLAITGKQLVLAAGGAFLIAKATIEIHKKVEGVEEDAPGAAKAVASTGSLIAQVVALDLVFSLDSVITAVGMVPPEQIWVMVVAVMAAVATMLAFAAPVSRFVEKHATVKVLALAFLILIGVMLVADAVGRHIPKGYIYAPMAFALLIELLNLRMKARKVHPTEPAVPTPTEAA